MTERQRTSAHTPGPLFRGEPRFIGKTVEVQVVREGRPDEPGHCIACCYGPHAREDATLFAAAPDLLWALCVLLDQMADGSPMSHALVPPEIERRAHAAISKAEGSR